MTLYTILTMITFSFAMSISPGPVNMMILTSGINNGFKKTFSFISGATIGFTLLLIFISMGFIVALNTYPDFLRYLELAGASFIIYMGYIIISSKSSLETKEEDKRYLKFYEGFLMQWLNPKAWIASIAGISMYSSSKEEVITFISIYFICCYLSLSFWGYIGSKSRVLLNSDYKFKLFNIIMGSLLILSASYLIFLNLSK